MIDIRDMQAKELEALLSGSSEAWGCYASVKEHKRYVVAIPSTRDKRRIRKCKCGCNRRSTHQGKCNGISMYTGCELSVRRWAKAR